MTGLDPVRDDLGWDGGFWAPPSETAPRRPLRLAPVTDAADGMEPRSRRGALLSVVLALRDDEAVLDRVLERLFAVVEPLGVTVELVCVDDGSTDRTLPLLLAWRQRDPRLRIVALARTTDRESALQAGLDAARGDLVAPLGDDLQPSPELLADFVRLWELGYDLVYGVAADAGGDSRLRRAAERLGRLFSRRKTKDVAPELGGFRLLDRAALDALKALPERERGDASALTGLHHVGVPHVQPTACVREAARRARRWLAVDPNTRAATAAPALRAWTSAGLLLAPVFLLAAVFMTVSLVLQGREPSPLALLAAAVLFGLAVQTASLGVLGEFVARLWRDAPRRPPYRVRRRYGFDD